MKRVLFLACCFLCALPSAILATPAHILPRSLPDPLRPEIQAKVEFMQSESSGPDVQVRNVAPDDVRSVAQSFTWTGRGALTGLGLRIGTSKTWGNRTQSYTLHVWSASSLGGRPETEIASYAFQMDAGLARSGDWLYFPFPAPLALERNGTYFFQLCAAEEGRDVLVLQRAQGDVYPSGRASQHSANLPAIPGSMTWDLTFFLTSDKPQASATPARARLNNAPGQDGGLVLWECDGRALINAHAIDTGQSPWIALLRDGTQAHFVVDKSCAEPTGTGTRTCLTGHFRLNQFGRELFPAELVYDIAEDGRQVRISLTAEMPSDDVMDELVNLGWSQTLALDPRKRVYFRGDNDTDWETRYFFQYTVDPRERSPILSVPDRNEWRFFSLDRFGPNAFRLWKSESERTSPLIMQEGERAAPLVQVYDQRGGLSVEYPRMAAPAAGAQRLRVDAAEGGRVRLDFWSEMLTPLSRSEARARRAAIFGVAHEIVLTLHASEDEVIDARAGIAERHPTPCELPADVVMREPEWVRTAATSGPAPDYVTGGYPFAQGELAPDQLAALRVRVAGQTVPVQTRPLAYWPDHSVKWSLLTFPINTPRTTPADSLANTPRVTLRDNTAAPVSIVLDPTITPPDETRLTTTTLDTGGVRIVNGPLMVELGAGLRWLRALTWHGRSLLAADAAGARLGYTDYVLDPGAFGAFEPATGGTPDPGELEITRLDVEETGPLRTVVRLEGLTRNAEPTRIILRLELLAGRPELRITHTAEFLFQDPRRTFLGGMGLELPLAPEIFADADPRDALTLLQTTPLHRTVLGEANPSRATPLPKAGGLQVRGRGVVITGSIRNFAELAPKALSIDHTQNRLRFELWPSQGAAMDVRRYSNYPHRGQLEGMPPPAADDWADTDYYGKDPFKGVSRTHEVLIAFADAATEAESIGRVADFQSPPLLHAGWDRYAGTRVVQPSATADEWPRTWEAWTRLTNFWLWHRERNTWKGFWNFGDLRHRFRTHHYGYIFKPEDLVKRLAGEEDGERQRDYHLSGDWAFDNGSNGWSNTEGLPNLFLQHEYLRHGNRAVYFAAEALARHSRDVVTRHDGIWFGRGTRHGVQPWSGANHEERQTSVTEYRIHYFLSGDGRSRDVVEKLHERHYSRMPVNLHASHSGRLQGLLMHWELTGSAGEAGQMQRYVATFASPKGIHLSPSVRFPGPQVTAPARHLNEGNQFLHAFGGMHALVEYHELTGDETLAAALIKMADAVVGRPIIENRRLGNGDYSWAPVAFAALHAPQPEPYRAFLRRYVEAYGWRGLYQPVTRNPAHWTGETGMMVHAPPISFFGQNWAGYLTKAIGSGEIWSADIAEQFAGWEKTGSRRPGGDVSWQSEFDGIHELDTYLGPQQPWRKPRPVER